VTRDEQTVQSLSQPNQDPMAQQHKLLVPALADVEGEGVGGLKQMEWYRSTEVLCKAIHSEEIVLGSWGCFAFSTNHVSISLLCS